EMLEGELNRIRYFFTQNLDFYNYYSSGSVYLDEELFTRGRYDLMLIRDEYSLMIDPVFCTVHSYKVAKILAYELLQTYLHQTLEQLEHKKSQGAQKDVSKSFLKWTGSKTDLIELLYALQTTGVFNNSQADVKKIALFLESVFNVSLGNYYRVFQEIRIRKKNRTSFLDRMRETLIHRMDEADEQGMRG
ncbi:MAG: RteC domain-containing protein, partial [Chitinophagaceae bacterium]